MSHQIFLLKIKKTKIRKMRNEGTNYRKNNLKMQNVKFKKMFSSKYKTILLKTKEASHIGYNGFLSPHLYSCGKRNL